MRLRSGCCIGCWLNPAQATAWYWFFNRFHKTEFNSEELLTALGDFVRDQVQENKQPAQSTIKNDATLLPRMYAQSQVIKGSPLKMRWILRWLNLAWSGKRPEIAYFPHHHLRAQVYLPPYSALPSRNFLLLKIQRSAPVEDLMLSRGEYQHPVPCFG